MMLTCKDLAHQADAYLDQELSLWKRFRIRLHLSMCNGCSRFMAQMRTTRDLVRIEATAAQTAPEGEDLSEIDTILAALHTNEPSGR